MTEQDAPEAPEAGRDPRSRPMAGDEVRVGTVSRQVVYISVTNKVVYDVVGAKHGQLVCELETWRRWARGGEIVRRGRKAFDREEKLKVDYWLSGQINGLANRCKPAKSCTPYDETIMALLEMGLDYALTLEGENKLRKVLTRRVETVE